MNKILKEFHADPMMLLARIKQLELEAEGWKEKYLWESDRSVRAEAELKFQHTKECKAVRIKNGNQES